MVTRLHVSAPTPALPRATRRLVQQIVSGWRTQALHVAVRLGLPDLLAGAPQDADALASKVECDGASLARLLRALCALGVCAERPDARFALTRAGRLLCRDSGGASLRPLALWWGGPLWPMWGELEYSVRTGRSAREKLTGELNYAYLERSAEVAHLFHEAMRAMTTLVVDDVARWPGWRGANTLVDVGGGHGQLALAVLAAHRRLHGVIFDLPNAGSGAQERIGEAGLGERCRFEAGSFFESVPAGADRYLLKSILHNWDDANCAAILTQCRAAAPAHARLLLVERVRPDRAAPGERDEGVARTDLNMLAGLGGRERTLDEFRALLSAAGFRIVDVRPTGFEFSLIEATSMQS